MGIFRVAIEEKMNIFGKLPIVSMSLTGDLCKNELLYYFKEKGIVMLHVVLEANRETIISRIENDSIRSKSDQSQQKGNVDWQMEYLDTKYPNAIRINTEGKTIHTIANEILAYIRE